MWMWVEPERRLSAKELMASNCDAGEDSWKSFGQQGDQPSKFYRKTTLKNQWKDWCWSSNTLTTWWEELTHKRLSCWERLKAKEEGWAENEMVGWHHWLNGHEFEQIPGDSEGQGSLAYWNPWGRKESDTTECLNSNNECREPWFNLDPTFCN